VQLMSSSITKSFTRFSFPQHTFSALINVSTCKKTTNTDESFQEKKYDSIW